MGEHMSPETARYCRDCFIGWRAEQAACWQGGCTVSLTKAQEWAMRFGRTRRW